MTIRLAVHQSRGNVLVARSGVGVGAHAPNAQERERRVCEARRGLVRIGSRPLAVLERWDCSRVTVSSRVLGPDARESPNERRAWRPRDRDGAAPPRRLLRPLRAPHALKPTGKGLEPRQNWGRWREGEGQRRLARS